MRVSSSVSVFPCPLVVYSILGCGKQSIRATAAARRTRRMGVIKVGSSRVINLFEKAD